MYRLLTGKRKVQMSKPFIRSIGNVTLMMLKYYWGNKTPKYEEKKLTKDHW